MVNNPNLPYSAGSIILVIRGADISPMTKTSQFPTEKDKNFLSKELRPNAFKHNLNYSYIYTCLLIF